MFPGDMMLPIPCALELARKERNQTSNSGSGLRHLKQILKLFKVIKD
jgi:hypothetical protein